MLVNNNEFRYLQNFVIMTSTLKIFGDIRKKFFLVYK